MNKVAWPVWAVTFYLVVYVALTQIPGYEIPAIILFSLSPFILIWLVLHVLINGTPSPYTFEERWYDDRPNDGA